MRILVCREAKNRNLRPATCGFRDTERGPRTDISRVLSRRDGSIRSEYETIPNGIPRLRTAAYWMRTGTQDFLCHPARPSQPTRLLGLGERLTAFGADVRDSGEGSSVLDGQSAPRLVAHRRRHRNQSGYSSFRKVLASSGWAFGVRSSKKLKYGATNGSGADTV